MHRIVLLIIVSTAIALLLVVVPYTLLNPMRVHGTPYMVEYNLVGYMVDREEFLGYAKNIFKINTSGLEETLNNIEEMDYNTSLFIAMNKFIVEKEIIESNNSLVTIEFKPTNLVILAYTEKPDYIEHRERYKFEIVNKTYRLTLKGSDITNQIYLLPGSIDEITPGDETLEIIITNKTMLEEQMCLTGEPGDDKDELVKYYKGLVERDKIDKATCSQDPKCIGGCRVRRVECIDGWPILVGDTATCCKIIDNIKHCITYPSTIATAKGDLSVRIYGGVELGELMNTVKPLLRSIIS